MNLNIMSNEEIEELEEKIIIEKKRRQEAAAKKIAEKEEIQKAILHAAKKEKINAGDRVQLCIGSGLDSGRWGTVLDAHCSVCKGDVKVRFDGDVQWHIISANRLIKEGEAWRPIFK